MARPEGRHDKKCLSFTLALGFQAVEMKGVQVFFKCNGWALAGFAVVLADRLSKPARKMARFFAGFPQYTQAAAVLDFLFLATAVLIYWDAAHGGAGFLP